MELTPENDLVARAAAAHLQAGRLPYPCLKRSRMLELDNQTWVELRSEDNETIGLYKLTPADQLRRK